MSELLPCPCGGDPNLLSADEGWTVVCKRPHCDWSLPWYTSRALAVFAWNRRSPPSVPPSVTVEELAEELCTSRYNDQTAWRGEGIEEKEAWIETAKTAMRLLSRTEKARERTGSISEPGGTQ